MTKRKALFLDRDGTLIHDAHYLKDPEKVEIIEGISESIKLVRQQGFLLFMHTNQSGIARGYFDSSGVNSCNKRMYRIFDWPDDFFPRFVLRLNLLTNWVDIENLLRNSKRKWWKNII